MILFLKCTYVELKIQLMLLKVTMLCYMLLAMSFTTVVLGEENGIEYPVYTPCNSTLIELIKNYWSFTETPENVQKRMEKDSRFVDYFTSYEDLNSDFKCVYLQAANSLFNFTLTLKDGSSPLRYDYEVTEKDGVMFGKPVAPFDAPEYRWTWYTVYGEDGLEVDYVCNDNHGVPTNPLADVFVGVNSFNNSKIMRDSQKFKSLLESWGINFTFTSDLECFTED